jgi:predicted house-cleaning NTP pyrophosphatase (Maf/HAM1 superfamily)
VSTEAAAGPRPAAGPTVEVYCHDTMYVIDLARLRPNPERYEAARGVLRCIQDRDVNVNTCPDLCESVQRLFRQFQEKGP